MEKAVLTRELDKIINISKDFGAETVLLFGSCLDGVELAQDIDIAVKGVKPERFFEMYGKILGAVNTEIDMIPLEYAREHFSKRILEKGRLIYGKKV